MADREKVIEGLEMSYKYSNVDEDNTLVPQQLVLDTLALLKAQEPRVMTYDELATFDGAFLIESSAVLHWVFFFDTDTKSDAVWVQGFDGKRCIVYREDYGTYMRCWTSRPTDEQRRVTPW